MIFEGTYEYAFSCIKSLDPTDGFFGCRQYVTISGVLTVSAHACVILSLSIKKISECFGIFCFFIYEFEFTPVMPMASKINLLVTALSGK